MPAANERALEKAKTIASDALIFDLEDAVSPESKDAARENAVKAASSGDYGKREVTIVELEPVGNYAVKPTFSDGHDSGLFTWEYLYFLGSQQDQLWADYHQRLQAAGVDRDAPMPVAGGHACGSHAH